MNPRKATGPDSIPAPILNAFVTEIAPILTVIYNKSLQEGTLPDDWRHANVTAINKKGARHDAANYRPVSLTSLCCKLLEHVIVSNMVKHLERHDILNDCKHGFRAKRSCGTQILTLYQELAASLDNQRLLKIHHYGILDNTFQWIASFLSQRIQQVLVEASHQRKYL